MKVVKIQDSKMSLDGKNDNYHYYAIFTNKKSGENLAIQLTHIARPNFKKVDMANKGIIGHIRLKELSEYADSGITRDIYSTTVGGHPISFLDGEIIIEKVSSSSAKKIKDFAFKHPHFVSYKDNHQRLKKKWR